MLLADSRHQRKAGCAKPFEQLNNEQLRQELRLRKNFDFGSTKAELTKSLKAILCGAQRVPSLLLLNPTQTFTEMNLNDYTVLDCEPLHDMKGHLENLFEELPNCKLLDKKIAGEVKGVLDVDLEKDMKTNEKHPPDYECTHQMGLFDTHFVQFGQVLPVLTHV